ETEGGPIPSRSASQLDGSPVAAVLTCLSRWMIPAVLIIFLTPFVALLFYSVPALDDFCKASLSYNGVPQRSALSITWLYYTQWSPRWVTTFTQSIVMSHVDLARAYGWLLLVVMVANCSALWYFFRTVFHLTPANSLLVAGVFYAAYVAGLADPAEQLYWFTGAVEYNLSFTTLLVLASLLYQARRGAWYYLTIVVLSIIIPAQHEIAGVFLFIVLLGGIVITRILRLPAVQWYVSFAVATVSQIIVMRSPGNSLRAAQEHRHLWDLAHLPRWVGHSFYRGLGWLSFPSILVAACCIFLLSQRDRELRSADGRPPAWFGIVGVCAMLAVCAEVALVEVASGVWIPYRVVAWFQFFFWLLFVCVIAIGIPELRSVRFTHATQVGAFVLLALTLFASDNFRSAISDLRGPAQKWHQASNARLYQTGGALEFQAPIQYPHMAMHQDLVADSRCWVNICLANYLHAKSVAVKDSSEECPH
ncbi:MAG: hypothetical protein WB987_14605, partial [Candidatus Acidiferrales bacterium]